MTTSNRKMYTLIQKAIIDVNSKCNSTKEEKTFKDFLFHLDLYISLIKAINNIDIYVDDYFDNYYEMFTYCINNKNHIK